MSYDFDFSDIEKRLTDINRRYQKAIKNLSYQIAEEIKGRARELTPIVTSRLCDGWHYKIEYIANQGYEIHILNNVEYAAHVEYGHRAGKKGFVKGKKMLHVALDELDKGLEARLESLLRKACRGR